MVDANPFGRGAGGGANRFGKKTVDVGYKSPWDIDITRQTTTKITKALESYILPVGPGKNDLRERFDLASMVADMPQMNHANMNLVAAALYIVAMADMEDGGFRDMFNGGVGLSAMIDAHFETVYRQFAGIEDTPNKVYTIIGLKANLMRYLFAFYQWMFLRDAGGEEDEETQNEDFAEFLAGENLEEESDEEKEEVPIDDDVFMGEGGDEEEPLGAQQGDIGTIELLTSGEGEEEL